MSILRDCLLVLNQGEESDPHREGDFAVAVDRPAFKKPSMYQVVLLNDDYTPMDFVVEVLMKFFGMNLDKATQVMLAVHTQGKGVCGVFSRDVAETKAAMVNQYSAESDHPLLCEIEKASL